MYINLRIKSFKLDSEEMCGKYPTLVIEFQNDGSISIPINKSMFRKLRKLILNYDIYGNRSYYSNVFQENKRLEEELKYFMEELEKCQKQ